MELDTSLKGGELALLRRALIEHSVGQRAALSTAVRIARESGRKADRAHAEDVRAQVAKRLEAVDALLLKLTPYGNPGARVSDRTLGNARPGRSGVYVVEGYR